MSRLYLNENTYVVTHLSYAMFDYFDFCMFRRTRLHFSFSRVIRTLCLYEAFDIPVFKPILNLTQLLSYLSNRKMAHPHFFT